MKRNLGISILIACFSFSSVNAGLATQVIDVSPVVVQPFDIQTLNQQSLDLDRQNRDEEIEIKDLIEQNDKLTQTALARQEDEGLAKIDQTMLNYRDALIARDRARILANGERHWSSRYGDLVALTEDADDMTIHRDLEDRSGMLAAKYQMLTELKDEMTALNEKLSNQRVDTIDQKEEIIDGFKKIAQQEQDKIQILVGKLGDMDQKITHLDDVIAEKDEQIAQLKDELARVQNEAANKDEMIKEQKIQIDILQAASKNTVPSSSGNVALPSIIVNAPGYQEKPALGANAIAKDQIIKQQEDQIALLKAQFKDIYSSSAGNMELPPIYVDAQNNQQKPANGNNNALAIARIQKEVYAKDEIIRQQAEQIVVLKAQTKGLPSSSPGSLELPPIIVNGSEEDQDMALKAKIDQLSLELKAKDRSIRWLKQVLAVAKEKAEYFRLTSRLDQIKAKDDRLKLAKQLIALQEEEASLLNVKGGLTLQISTLIDRHVAEYEKRIKVLLANHQIQDIDLKDRVAGLKNDLNQKQQEIDSLKQQLEEKITHQRDQGQLLIQIQDLRAQLQDNENQVNVMKEKIQSGQETQEQVDTLKQQLADAQNKVDSLKQELADKTAESDKMTLMMADYQKKLEFKDNAYNQQLRQVLTSKNYQAQMQKQITYLSDQLHEKEAQVIKIKMDMYDLQKATNAKDTELQANDLNLSMMQQKAMDDKIKEYKARINGLQAANANQVQEIKSLKTDLAMTRQQLEGMPSSDEITFLRTGLKKATLQLSQKNAMLLQIKANADEYAKEFKEQTDEFQSLKAQLLDAQEQLARKDEDLKYKDMAITRLKERFAVKEGDLDFQIRALTQRIDTAEKKLMGKTRGNLVQALQEKLNRADLKVKDLQNQLDQLKDFSKNEPAGEKLKQALNKMNEEGRMINVLTEKLLECGKSMDFTKDIDKQ